MFQTNIMKIGIESISKVLQYGEMCTKNKEEKNNSNLGWKFGKPQMSRKTWARSWSFSIISTDKNDGKGILTRI